MNDIIDFSAAGFVKAFDLKGVRGYVSINMEMFREGGVLQATGRYCIYCLHPWSGSCYFIITMNAQGHWYSADLPSFLDQPFINWIGDEINQRNS
ncbi:MAG: hypothetical protein WKF97_11215 [Chitinophagaceae bacterium]